MIHKPPPSLDERLSLIDNSRPLVTRSGIQPSQTVRKIFSHFSSALGFSSEDRAREEENHSIYTGLKYGQMPKALLAKLAEEGRMQDLSQFNYVMKKVNDMVGTLTSNWYDIDFLSVDEVGSDTVTAFKSLFYSDKDLCDWDSDIMTFLRNGAIYGADLMMYVDYSYDNSFGNIGIRALEPGTVIRDPNWTTNNSKDCRYAFTVSYMTAEEMKMKYRTKSERIDLMIKLKELEDGIQGDLYTGRSIPRSSLNDEYNKEYRVIEYHNMRTEKRKLTVGMSNGMLVDVPENATEEWYAYNGVDRNNTISSYDSVEVYYITAICPELDMESPLEDRKAMLQLGRLPIIHWSYNRHNGKDIGIVDLLRDPQRYYNAMLSLSKEIVSYSKRARIIDPAAFGDDTVDLAELEKKIARPGATLFGASNFSRDFPNAIMESGASTYTGNELALADTARNASESLTPINSAMAGQGAGERSAEHFNAKREQGEINSTTLNASVKQFNNELAECYFYAAQSLYGGMYRVFKTKNGDSIEINVPMADGTVANSILDVSRAKVIVSESPEGVSKRANDRTAAFQALQYMGDGSPIGRSYLMEIIFNSMDNIPEAKRAEINKGMALDREVLRTSQMAQVAQANAVVQQSMAPAPQPMPQEQEQGQPMPQQEVPQEVQANVEEQRIDETITE